MLLLSKGGALHAKDSHGATSLSLSLTLTLTLFLTLTLSSP